MRSSATVLRRIAAGALAACLMLTHSAFARAEIAHILLDTSGSMQPWQRWLDPALKRLEARTVDRVMMLGQVPGFALVGFTEEAGELATGWAEDIGATVSSTRFSGGVEDGLMAVQQLLDSGVRGATVLLISDEPRTATVPVDLPGLVEQLKAANTMVHAVLRPAWVDLQLPIPLQRITAEAAYDYAGQPRPLDSRLAELRDQAYGVLAEGSGGSVWLLDGVRDRPADFADQLADWMLAQRLALMQPEVTVSGLLRPGQAVNFDASGSRHHVEGRQVAGWRWDFDGDGVVDSTGALAAHVFRQPGSYTVELELVDDQPRPERQSVSVPVQIQP